MATAVFELLFWRKGGIQGLAPVFLTATSSVHFSAKKANGKRTSVSDGTLPLAPFLVPSLTTPKLSVRGSDVSRYFCSSLIAILAPVSCP